MRQTEEEETMLPRRQQGEGCRQESQNGNSPQKLEEARKDRFFPRAFKGRMALLTLWTSSLQNNERIDFYFSSHPVCGTLYSSPEKPMQVHLWHICLLHLPPLSYVSLKSCNSSPSPPTSTGSNSLLMRLFPSPSAFYSAATLTFLTLLPHQSRIKITIDIKILPIAS